jgi:hypothetical protein
MYFPNPNAIPVVPDRSLYSCPERVPIDRLFHISRAGLEVIPARSATASQNRHFPEILQGVDRPHALQHRVIAVTQHQTPPATSLNHVGGQVVPHDVTPVL